MIEMLTAGTRPILSSSSRDSSPLIKVNRHTSTKDTQKKNSLDVYSYRDEIHEDFNIQTYNDPYSSIDPPEDIYSSTSSAASNHVNIEVISNSTQNASNNNIPISPYHNRYLTPQQLRWWGLHVATPPFPTSNGGRASLPSHVRLTQYHEDMLRKQQEEKEYQERITNHNWLQSLHACHGNRNIEGGSKPKPSRDRGNITQLIIFIILESSTSTGNNNLARPDQTPHSSSTQYGPPFHSKSSHQRSSSKEKIGTDYSQRSNIRPEYRRRDDNDRRTERDDRRPQQRRNRHRSRSRSRSRERRYY